MSDESCTPLFYAAINYRIDAMKLLLELGADPMVDIKALDTFVDMFSISLNSCAFSLNLDCFIAADTSASHASTSI